LFKKHGQKMIQKSLVGCRKNKGHTGRIKMKPLTADFNLPFESRKIILDVVRVVLFIPKQDQALNDLSQQKLVVKWYISTPVFQ
jgi:hypothetical protein